MERCIEETARRRVMQTAHNAEHGVTPISVSKSIAEVRFSTRVADARGEREERKVAEPARGYAVMETESLEKMLDQQMREAAAAMDFELAAQLRDQLFELRARRDTASKARRVRARGAADYKVSHPPIVPPLASHGRLAVSESDLVEWGRRLGHVASAPLLVTISENLALERPRWCAQSARGTA
jgi:hypothetical protein